jgi:hypothetical protein
MNSYFNAPALVGARTTLPPRRGGIPVRPSRHPTTLRSPGTAKVRGNSGETPDQRESSGRTRQPPSSIPVKSVNGLPRRAYGHERQNRQLCRITYRVIDAKRFLNGFVGPECREQRAQDISSAATRMNSSDSSAGSAGTSSFSKVSAYSETRSSLVSMLMASLPVSR